MRRLVLSLILMSLGLVLFFACLGMVITEFAPLHPGNPFFPLQRFSELERARLVSNNTGKALYYLNLIERRTKDLSTSDGTPAELPALVALDEAIDLATAAVTAVPDSDKGLMTEKLVNLSEGIYSILTELKGFSGDSTGIYSLVEGKVNSLRLLFYEPKTISGQEMRKARNILLFPQIHSAYDPNMSGAGAAGLDVPHSIQFPPGSPGAEHAFFPLLGAHAQLTCESCHTNGQFAGTSPLCSTCHANVKPASHFNGECSACHTAVSWRDVQFDHNVAGATNCRACHTEDKPANHYSGQCSACHNTNAWRPASFNHQAAGATDCQACHSSNKPANHYAGQCSACHNTSAWRQVSFNHAAAGAVDCQSCHSKDKPANHFEGQCSSCHDTKSWKTGSLDHQGLTDCQSCHSGDRPANHYSGQCSTCHNTSAWQPASFNHDGQTDCQSCHNRPANHYGGQCSSCHNTNAWQPASFNHQGQTDCQSCHTRPANHYGGQCSSCHNTSAWQPASFNHDGQTDCQSCHTRPANHYGGQCSSCHNTSAWQPASFNHQGQTDCQSCHTRPANHWGGQCSNCHNPQNWHDIQVAGHTFPINHKGAGGNCAACHPGGNSNWTCYNCHNQAETEKHHAEKNIFDIGSRCIECHPTGDD